jgi:hypothetical protein
MTANDTSNLPAPLRSRFDIVALGPPGPEHFDTLLSNVLRDLALRLAIPITLLPEIPPWLDRELRRRFAAHRSVRLLGRAVEVALAGLIRARPRISH